MSPLATTTTATTTRPRSTSATPNWLLVRKRERSLLLPVPSNQIQNSWKETRRLPLKRSVKKSMCASEELNGNAHSPHPPKTPASSPKRRTRTGSTPKNETNADPLKIPSAWLDLPKNLELCGAAAGLAQISVCHPGFPRLESYAL